MFFFNSVLPHGGVFLSSNGLGGNGIFYVRNKVDILNIDTNGPVSNFKIDDTQFDVGMGLTSQYLPLTASPLIEKCKRKTNEWRMRRGE